jgi:hypothetical protein
MSKEFTGYSLAAMLERYSQRINPAAMAIVPGNHCSNNFIIALRAKEELILLPQLVYK